MSRDTTIFHESIDWTRYSMNTPLQRLAEYLLVQSGSPDTEFSLGEEVVSAQSFTLTTISTGQSEECFLCSARAFCDNNDCPICLAGCDCGRMFLWVSIYNQKHEPRELDYDDSPLNTFVTHMLTGNSVEIGDHRYTFA